MFHAAFFILRKKWKNPKCPSNNANQFFKRDHIFSNKGYPDILLSKKENFTCNICVV